MYKLITRVQKLRREEVDFLSCELYDKVDAFFQKYH